MKLIKKIGLWIAVGLLAVLALAAMPSLACFIAIVILLLIVPVEQWQNFLHKYINGKVKVIVIVVLTILMFVTFPVSETSPKTDLPSEPTTSDATEVTDVSTEPSTDPTAEPTTSPTTEPPHVHSFSVATCIAPKTCVCGVTEGNANGHSWNEATCTTPKTCAVCGETSGSTTEHNYINGKCTICSRNDPNYVSETLVWIPTNGGKKYHSKSSCSKMKNPIQVTKTEAINRGFEPCGKCY
jgi:hypothetical protein